MYGSSPSEDLPGRTAEKEALLDALASPRPAVISIHGPRRVGKTVLLAEACRSLDRPVVHLVTAPEEEPELREALAAEAGAILGELPRVERPELLPTGDPGVAWVRLLDSILEGLRRRGGGVLALDGVEALGSVRRRLPGEVIESWGRVAEAGVPLHLVLVARTRRGLEGWPTTDRGGAEVEISGLPFRTAGWLTEPPSPREAFRSWAVFGDHPGHLAGLRPGESLGEGVIRRVLDPAGDLHDAPLRRLDATFQAPPRYLAILRVLAGGDRAWGTLARAMGEEGGNRLAPYLRRLGEEGLVRVRQPLGSSSRSRDRRYGLVDPFVGFWLRMVLPRRSELLRVGPEAFWDRVCKPGLQEHLDRWMPEVARRWLREHAEEGMGAPAREVGAIWGAEGPDLDVVGRLASGVVAYGVVQRGEGEAGAELLRALRERVEATRYGIGREARASLLFLQGGSGEELRRQVARDRLARILTMDDLMGWGKRRPGPPK
jgi:uncharacterized protein